MSRHGKIARLPLKIREELNHRLLNGEPGEPLLAWLNPLPEVQTILKDQFAGVPISKQNLHEWRSGGFAEWEFKRDLKYDATETQADGAELNAVTDGCLADHLSTVLAARYASLIRSWHGETTDEFRAQLKVLRVLIQDVSLLRRWDHNAIKITLATERLEDERYKYHRKEMAELKKKVEHQQTFIQVLESMVNDSPATPPPPKPAGQTKSKPASHDSPTSHSSPPAESPEPPPVKVPVTASRESAADSPKTSIESNPVKVGQSDLPVSNAMIDEARVPPISAENASKPTGLPSPCVGICQRDGGGYCTGCLRSVPEITRWNQMPPEQKRQCLDHLAQRRQKKEHGE